MGKILRVNLSNRRIEIENLPEEEILRKFMGCDGLATLILYDELPTGATPFSSQNKLVFMTGPLTGTGFTPGGTDFTIVTLNVETGITIGHSHSHGFFGSYLKFAGYDGIIVEEVSQDPVYLWIHDEVCEIRDAKNFWGKDTHQTEDLIKGDVGEPEARVAAIGPAGENLVVGAIVENDYNHNAAHSVGAVMGSKRLKAVAVYGSKLVPKADKAKLIEAGDSWRSKIKQSTSKAAKQYSVQDRYEFPMRGRGLGYPKKNWQSTEFEEIDKDWDKDEIFRKPCFQCFRCCPYDVRIGTGPKAGYVATLGAGSEYVEGSSTIVGIGGPISRYLSDVIDRLGIEGSAVGHAMGLAFECYEKGIINRKHTDGLELKWGDPEAVEKLVHKICYREGWLGNVLAKGAKRAAELIGGEARKLVVHVKGASPNIHMWKARYGTMLGQIVGEGSSWNIMYAPDTFVPRPDLGYEKVTDPLDLSGKPEEVRRTSIDTHFFNVIGACWFAIPHGFKGIHTDIVDALSAVTGWDLTTQEALEVGERSANLQRIFSVVRGRSPASDYEDVGQRFLDPIPDGESKGVTIAPYLRDLVARYYQLMGWDIDTGKPLKETLTRLGLQNYIKDLYPSE